MTRVFRLVASFISGATAHQATLTFTNHGFLASSSGTSLGGTYCCCGKKSSCEKGDLIKIVVQAEKVVAVRILEDRPEEDATGVVACCRTTPWLMKKGCPMTGYRHRIGDFSPNIDTFTCLEVDKEAPSNTSREVDTSPSLDSPNSKLRRTERFRCGEDLVCPEPEEPEEAPLVDSKVLTPEEIRVLWSSRPKICRGVHRVLGFMAPALPRSMDFMQLTGITKSAAANGFLPAFGELMMNITAPIAIAGSLTGALVNTLKLIEGVCLKGWEFLTTCGAGLNMLSVVLAVVGMSLAFTGIGVPLSALLLGGSSFVVRRLGPEICGNGGLWKTLQNIGKAASEILQAFIDNRVVSADGLTANAAKHAAINFFRIFWAMLKSLPGEVASMIRKVLTPQVSIDGDNEKKREEAEFRRVRMCCAARAANFAFDPEELRQADGAFGEGSETSSICLEAAEAKSLDETTQKAKEDEIAKFDAGEATPA